MKRFIAIPILFLYLVAVSGVKIHLHYCGSKLESWGLYDGHAGCNDGVCKDDGSDKEDGCCKDEIVLAKIGHEQNFVQYFTWNVNHVDIGIAILYSLVQVPLREVSKVSLLIHGPNAPPGLWQNTPLYKLHSSLVYYG